MKIKAVKTTVKVYIVDNDTVTENVFDGKYTQAQLKEHYVTMYGKKGFRILKIASEKFDVEIDPLTILAFKNAILKTNEENVRATLEDIINMADSI